MTMDLGPLAAQRGINLDKLKVRFPALYKIVSRETGQTAGIHALDLSLFQEASHKYLLECAERIPGLVVPAEPQIDMARLEREEQAAIQKAADEAAGRNRLEQYAREQGLEDTQANATTIMQWIVATGRHLSEASVDDCIRVLRSQLTWKPKAAPVVPPVAEVLEPLPNGEPRLPLDTTPTKKHSTAQLKDWLARTNAGKIMRPRGSFISSF
jgi:hypothetical protein